MDTAPRHQDTGAIRGNAAAYRTCSSLLFYQDLNIYDSFPTVKCPTSLFFTILYPTLIPKCHLYIKHLARGPYVALDRSKYGMPQFTVIIFFFFLQVLASPSSSNFSIFQLSSLAFSIVRKPVNNSNSYKLKKMKTHWRRLKNANSLFHLGGWVLFCFSFVKANKILTNICHLSCSDLCVKKTKTKKPSNANVYVSKGEWAVQQDNYWLFLSHLLALMYWFMLNLWKGYAHRCPPPRAVNCFQPRSLRPLRSFIFCWTRPPSILLSGPTSVGLASGPTCTDVVLPCLVACFKRVWRPPLPCHLEADWKPIHNLSLME